MREELITSIMDTTIGVILVWLTLGLSRHGLLSTGFMITFILLFSLLMSLLRIGGMKK